MSAKQCCLFAIVDSYLRLCNFLVFAGYAGAWGNFLLTKAGLGAGYSLGRPQEKLAPGPPKSCATLLLTGG